jgi:ferritin
LHWYVTEQVEEEDTVNDIVAKLKLIGGDANALLTIDKDLGARTTTVPTDFSTSVTAQAKAV